MRALPVGRVMRRGWMALVTLLVVVITGLGISRLHGIFGSGDTTTANAGLANEIVPFNPKQVVLEVFGEPGAVATINYLDVDAQPQQVIDAPLPWSHTITTTKAAVLGNVVAQGTGSSLGCRITVNGVVKDERTVDKVDAYTYCLDKSG